MDYVQAFTGLAVAALVAFPAILCLSPQAKISAASAIRRGAFVLCGELTARATAQRAAQAAWNEAYRVARGADRRAAAAGVGGDVTSGVPASQEGM